LEKTILRARASGWAHGPRKLAPETGLWKEDSTRLETQTIRRGLDSDNAKLSMLQISSGGERGESAGDYPWGIEGEIPAQPFPETHGLRKKKKRVLRTCIGGKKVETAANRGGHL